MRLAFVTLLLLPITMLSAQVRVTGVEMNAEWINEVDDSGINVEIIYQLDGSLTGPVTLKAINFTDYNALQVYISDSQSPVTLERKGQMLSAGFTPVGGINTLKVAYTLYSQMNPDDFELVIPVVFPDLTSSEASEDFFNASVRLENGTVIHERFPVQSWTDEDELHTLSIQAIPSMIKIRGGNTPKPILGVLSMVDSAVILLLLILMWGGWKKIRQV